MTNDNVLYYGDNLDVLDPRGLRGLLHRDELAASGFDSSRSEGSPRASDRGHRSLGDDHPNCQPLNG